jgi:hypothetical protein
VLFDPNPVARDVVGLEYLDGKREKVEIPKAALPDKSPATRRDDRRDPVCGHTIVKEPPPPPGVSAVDGLLVDTHKTLRLPAIICVSVITFFGFQKKN